MGTLRSKDVATVAAVAEGKTRAVEESTDVQVADLHAKRGQLEGRRTSALPLHDELAAACTDATTAAAFEELHCCTAQLPALDMSSCAEVRTASDELLIGLDSALSRDAYLKERFTEPQRALTAAAV
ncbi:hypothetical protein JKP88DRAFT_275809 [Tribonema minus]|uniref:Uncharacterized protein n=1 Tax=Tribonema minus TaxID=303371 RepID=A0A836CJ79_9STRA|nr:hypothetical protein JKP88DRAFT_275809 [Tribonema minus]